MAPRGRGRRAGFRPRQLPLGRLRPEQLLRRGAEDAIETYAGGSGLQYLGAGNWQFNWKVPKSYPGQCRVLRLDLADGATLYTAVFQFR